MSWLLAVLALGAMVGTWTFVTGRWDLSLPPAKAQADLERARQRRRQTRLAESILGQFPSGQ